MSNPTVEDIKNQIDRLSMADMRALQTQLNVPISTEMRRKGYAKKKGGKTFGDPKVLEGVVEEMDGGAKMEKRIIGGAKDSERARKLGKKYMKNIMKMDPEVKDLVGGGFLNDFLEGFTSVLDVGQSILGAIPTPQTQIASKIVGAVNTGAKAIKKTQKGKGKKMPVKSKKGEGKKMPVKSKKVDGRKERGKKISELMKGGMSLGEASKYLKNEKMKNVKR